MIQTKTIAMILLIAIAIGTIGIAIETGIQSAQAQVGCGPFGSGRHVLNTPPPSSATPCVPLRAPITVPPPHQPTGGG